MLNAKINYPYPVIRAELQDYRSTIFKGSLKVNLRPNGYVVYPSFEIHNTGIEKLISQGRMTYALEVQCSATWFRKLFIVNKNGAIFLDPSNLHERVDLTPCIVATTPISDFTNSDFDKEYSGISFDINSGDIIAIGETKFFDAIYMNDVIKNGSSIVNVTGSEKAKEISCDFTSNRITITMPAEQYVNYVECGAMKTKIKTLNAILIVPALIEGIGIIAQDMNTPEAQSGLSSKAWYKTINVNLKRVSENNETKYRQLLETPFTATELLLDNNYEAALEFVHSVE